MKRAAESVWKLIPNRRKWINYTGALIQLKIEQVALKKEQDAASKKRLEILEEEIADLEKEYSDLEEIWKSEKSLIARFSIDKEKLEHARTDLEMASRSNDLARMSELQYGIIPALEKQLTMAAPAETQKMTLLRNKVTEEEIAEVVSKWTGIPSRKWWKAKRDKLLRMEEYLSKRVVGQDEALKAVSNAIRRSRAGLSDPNRPQWFIFILGAYRCGQNWIMQSLGRVYVWYCRCNGAYWYVEFMEKHSVARLIGAPPGYVGYEEGGYLTELVRRKPYSVIWWMKSKKAHPDVFNVLLQVLDDGV